jgi:hypothetical protein
VKEEPTNIAASVHARLLNRAKMEGCPLNELLQYFAMERFLYRLSRSPYANRFVLKGALMLQFWGGTLARTTKDIDLLGLVEISDDDDDCTQQSCGNGIQEGNEECDGADFGGTACESLGYGHGALLCDDTCQIVSTGCTTPPTCGNGVREGAEACDGEDFGRRMRIGPQPSATRPLVSIDMAPSALGASPWV